MKIVFALVLLTGSWATGQVNFPPKGSAQQRANFERGKANQASYDESRFARAGFEPLSKLRAEKREVKRALFSDPYGMISLPGVEVERTSDGSVKLNVIRTVGAPISSLLPGSVWARLNRLQGTSLDPRPYVPWDPPKTNEPPPSICHGWGVLLGAGDAFTTKSASWGACGGSQDAKLNLASELARLAVSTKPECTFDEQDVFWSFANCFDAQHSDQP